MPLINDKIAYFLEGIKLLRNNRLLCQFYIYITGAVNTTRKCLSIVLLLEESCHTLSQTKHQCQHKNKNGQVVVINAIRLHQIYKFFKYLRLKFICLNLIRQMAHCYQMCKWHFIDCVILLVQFIRWLMMHSAGIADSKPSFFAKRTNDEFAW